MDEQLELNEDLLFAAGSGDHKKVEELLDAGANIHFFDELSKSALHYAVQGAHRQLVHFLLEKGANVNAHLRDNAGDTPITIAAYEGHYAVSKLLLKAGADPYITAWMGKDALDYALGRKDSNGEKIKELIVGMHPPSKDRKYRYK
ncbi:ankyrin repeat domain-containing protein [Hellea balneolensis]|uniref:ankyrin repeat domain-containing protein n=1 Tax=Hellea balneolensis TaxID=287478 RepID=UPI0003FB95FF|nr:ankyrin repeat domain-containing protein [Hellea balneolensis]